MFVQVKRNETCEEGNWSNFKLFSSLELIVLAGEGSIKWPAQADA